MYPICDNSKINGEGLLYSLCGNLQPILSIPCPINPNMKNKNTIKTIINRIHLMLYICHKFNHILITGLWGCGAFGANPYDMAELWQEAINSSKYLPTKIVFAITIDNYSTKWGRYEQISKIFQNIKKV